MPGVTQLSEFPIPIYKESGKCRHADTSSTRHIHVRGKFTRYFNISINAAQRKTLYSLRHSFADACRNADVPYGIRYQLMGHVENNKNAAGYGTGASTETLKRELAKVDPLR